MTWDKGNERSPSIFPFFQTTKRIKMFLKHAVFGSLRRRGATDGRVLNIGSGNNPLRGAVNVDIRRLDGVDVVGDANQLPFKKGAFDYVIAQNPYGFNPLTGDVGRVLTPGGTLMVADQLNNPFFRDFMKNTTLGDLRLLGWEWRNQGAASDALKFGTPKTSAGQKLNTRVFIQATFRRIQ